MRLQPIGHWRCSPICMPGRLLTMLPLHICHAAALCNIWTRAMNSVDVGLGGGPGWTEALYTLVVDRLAKAPHGAVIVKHLYTALNSNNLRAAKRVVEAMVQADILAYRPPSGGLQFAGTCCLPWVELGAHFTFEPPAVQSGQGTSQWRLLAQSGRMWSRHPQPHICTVCASCMRTAPFSQTVR